MPLLPRCEKWEQPSFIKAAVNALKLKLLGNNFRKVLRQRPAASRFRTEHTRLSIHDLPPEIFMHIFALGSWDDVWLPVRISHVCSFWRVIALYSPCLWRRIALSPHIRMWKQRIKRANPCSLDVQLYSPTFSGSSCLNFDSVQQYMLLVTPYIRHWRSLEVKILTGAPFILNGALAGCCGWGSAVEAPVIEEIAIVYRAIDRWREYTRFTLFGGVAPRLRKLTLEGVRLTWLPSLFGNLTYLDYTLDRFTRNDQAVDWLLSMVEISTQLMELRVCFPSRMTSPRTPLDASFTAGQVTLVRLVRLQLRVDTRDIPIELFRLVESLNMPVLKSLHLIDLSRSRVPFRKLRTFVRLCRLPRSVTVLHVEHRWDDPHIAWHRIFPMLQQLVFPARLSARTAVHMSYRSDSLHDLTGRIALVTGGGTGIGLMIAKGLAANGAKVYITGRRRDTLEAASAGDQTGAMEPLMMDVTDKASIVEARRVIEKKEGKLHILVNNAGQVGPVSDTSALDAQTLGDALFQESPDAWAKLHAVNTFSVYYVTTAFLRLLDEGSKDVHGYTSCVINITSISGIVRLAQGHFAYNSSKAAASHLTKMLSTELALKKIPIRVNAIAPGVYESEMTYDNIAPEDVDRVGRGISAVPAGRAGAAQEIAGTALYLASRAGCYTNGQEIIVDGGYVAVNP